MTKDEFIERIEKGNINTGEYLVVIDELTDAPLVVGCVFKDNVWRIYETKERSGHFIIKEIENENDAFDYFYELVLTYH
ncbi:hypothetical protein ACWV26_08740 [Rummeliibacillus sp. JY-2-4R]